MSSLFGQLSGFQFPDVQMNSGPLPSTAGGPAGSDGSVDGVINGTSALLENISPYALGKSARTGSDRNYQQIPHRFQYIIPRMWIPHFSSDTFFSASHAVDQGDVAFLMYGGDRAWWTCRDQYQTRAPQSAFGGIDMVNYILLCLQASKASRWGHIRKDLVAHDPFHAALTRRAKQDAPLPFDAFNVFRAVRLLVHQHFVPHGICAGSEHQGGQHEHQGGRPVQAAVNFIITMTVDGKNIDLVNYWYGKDMTAGDELIFRLEKQDCKLPREFHISRYYKDPVTVPAQIEAKAGWDYSYWQLVPDILRLPSAPIPAPEWCDHHCQGYWRVAQTFQTRKQNNINAFHRGMPLEVTFAPVWQSFAECEDLTGWSDSYIQSHVTQHDAAELLAATITIGPLQTSTTWTYRGAETLRITDVYAEGNYRLEFLAPARCKILGANVSGKSIVVAATPETTRLLPKSTMDCCHVIFCDAVDEVTQVYEPHLKESLKPQKIAGTGPRSFQHDIAHKAGGSAETHLDFLVTFIKVAHIKDVGKCKVSLTEEYLKNNKDAFNEFDHKFWTTDNETLPAAVPVTLQIAYANKDRAPPLPRVELRDGGDGGEAEQGGGGGEARQALNVDAPQLLRVDQVARLPALGLGLEVPEVVAIKKRRAKTGGDILRDASAVSTDDCGRSAV
jgi:hypothetical protein